MVKCLLVFFVVNDRVLGGGGYIYVREHGVSFQSECHVLVFVRGLGMEGGP